MSRNVIVYIAIVFSQSCVKVPTSLTNVEGLGVQGMPVLTRSVSGEKQNSCGNLKIFPGSNRETWKIFLET